MSDDTPTKGDVRRRTFALDIEQRDGDAVTFAASLSSEAPVERDGFLEVLDHAPQCIDLSRAARGLPLLLNHDATNIVGRARRLRIEGRRLRGTLAFGNRPEAKAALADVAGDVLTDVSVGYRVLETRREPTRNGELPTVRVTKWQPLEVSLVALPADPTVGIGRASTLHTLENRPMTTISTHETDPQFPDRTEDERVASIRRLAQHRDEGGKIQYGGAAIAGGERAIAEGWSSRDYFRWAEKHVPYVMRDPIRPEPDSDGGALLGFSPHDRTRYSLHRAIRAMASRDWRGAEYELEASDAVARQLGREARGLFVPADILATPQTRAIAKSGSGANIIATDLMPQTFIELLRNASRVLEAGATILPNLRGNVAIPRRTSGATAQWLAEAGTVTATDSVFDQVTLSPKTVAARTDLTRKMLLQSTPEVEALTRADLAQSLGTAVDLAATFGTSVGAQPRGINATSGIGTVAIGTNGGPLTWAKVVELESAVANANADGGRLGYLTNSKVRGSLKTIEKAATTGQFIWPDAAEAILNGHPAYVSNQIPSTGTKGTGTNLSAMIFGNWADLLIGEWGTLDITADPYTLGDSGGAVVRAFYDIDIAVRHPESFAIVVDIVTS